MLTCISIKKLKTLTRLRLVCIAIVGCVVLVYLVEFVLSTLNIFRTLTTPVTLFKCLESIKKHAFVKSPYPVIVTLEDHLTPELQAKAAEVRFCYTLWRIAKNEYCNGD